MKCGSRCVAELTASQMRPHFTDCRGRDVAGAAAPTSPGLRCARTSSYARSRRQPPARGPAMAERASQAWTPTGAANVMRLCYGSQQYQAQYARALNKMLEPASSLTSGEQLGPTREELESPACTSTGAAIAVRLALRRETHSEPHAGAFSHRPARMKVRLALRRQTHG
jgi:hypothetical protein